MTRPTVDLSGAVAVVVGATGGIGQILCRRLADAGVRLVAADVDGPRLHELLAALPGAHTDVVVDSTDVESMRGLLATVERDHGRIDVLVHAGGVVDATALADRSPEEIERELRINLVGPLQLTGLALPLLRRGRLGRSLRAHVVALGSLGGVLPMPGEVVYAAGKAGLRSAMLSLGMQLEPEHIAVTCVLPSAVDTPMLHAEAAGEGNALQFMATPQAPEAIADRVLAVLGHRRPELYTNRADGVASRLAMVVPNLVPKLLPALDPLGRRGREKYRTDLRRRGLL